MVKNIIDKLKQIDGRFSEQIVLILCDQIAFLRLSVSRFSLHIIVWISATLQSNSNISDKWEQVCNTFDALFSLRKVFSGKYCQYGIENKMFFQEET